MMAFRGIFLLAVATLLLFADARLASRGMPAPKKKDEKKVAVPAEASQKTSSTLPSDAVEMMPPMEAYEALDIDVDDEEDHNELEDEENELHATHPGRMFSTKSTGGSLSAKAVAPQDPKQASSHKYQDHIANLHKSVNGEPKKAAAPVKLASAKPKAPSVKEPAFKRLQKETDGDEKPKPQANTTATAHVAAAKVAPKPAPQIVKAAVQVQNATHNKSSSDAIARLHAETHATKVADATQHQTPKKATPKKTLREANPAAARLSKHIEEVHDVEAVDQKVAEKLAAALPTDKRVAKPAPVVISGEGEEPPAHPAPQHDSTGKKEDAIAKLHAHAHGLHADKKSQELDTGIVGVKKAEAAQDAPASTAPAKRTASKEQLAAARQAQKATVKHEALQEALRDIDVNGTAAHLSVSKKAAEKLRDLAQESEKPKADAPQSTKSDEEVKKDWKEALHRAAEEGRAEEAKQKAAKVETVPAKKPASQSEPKALQRLSQALGVTGADNSAQVPAPQSGSDVIQMLHHKIHPQDQKKAMKVMAKAMDDAKKDLDKKADVDQGIMPGFHHNKNRDSLAPVLR